MFLTLSLRAACTVETDGLLLSLPNYGDRGDVWAACMRSNFQTLNDSIISTDTFVLQSLTDVQIASGSFISASSVTYTLDSATITITGVKCFTLFASTVGGTGFNIAFTSGPANTDTWSYLFTSSVTVSSGAMFSDWRVPSSTTTAYITNLPSILSLHVIEIPTAVAMPSDYGCIVRYWRKLNP